MRVLPLWDMQERRRTPLVTAVLLAAMVAVFLYQILLALQGGSALGRFVQEAGVVPARWRLGWWSEVSAWQSLLSALFVHGGWAHLAGNAWFLWVFGRSLEERLGSGRYLVLYLAAGVAGNLAHVAAHPDSALPLIGASGAISGVLGGYFRVLPRAWVWTLVPWLVPILPVPAVIFLLVWFGVQLAQGVGALLAPEVAMAGGVAWWAHAGGFVAGLALAGLLSPSRRRGRSRPRRRPARVGAR